MKLYRAGEHWKREGDLIRLKLKYGSFLLHPVHKSALDSFLDIGDIDNFQYLEGYKLIKEIEKGK